MKVIFFVLFILIISNAQSIISNEEEGRSIIQINEEAHEFNGNLYGNGNIEVSTRLNSKNVIVASKNEHEHKHELSDAISFSTGGGGRGGGASEGGGMGGGGGVAGGAAGGIIGGGIVGGTVANGGHNGGHNGTHNSATTLSAVPHFCVSTLILCMSFWL
ncbi:hypothetical protein MtrunA17_Chr4g0001911 [Medicago truncatula]|uniref:Transmembrane protein n=1 Tax=Medicago truncatula TaxID=3880 RepID=A0A072UFV8_MEDTR|nr:keratin, type I cytoskeletal 10 [Medicago truncatula]KEH28567.1 hypothetical protein MTR_4g007600 [Medicago truncatula]RHN58390.1 hypothetical protein MtrunA17_Chr4g0001911 [Medicago truncatula]